jgi:hypothetical protein
VTIEQGSKRLLLRSRAPGCAGAVFKAVGVALPPLVQQIPTGTPPPDEGPTPLPCRRGMVPRRPEFSGFAFYIKKFVKVTVQLDTGLTAEHIDGRQVISTSFGNLRQAVAEDARALLRGSRSLFDDGQRGAQSGIPIVQART